MVKVAKTRTQFHPRVDVPWGPSVWKAGSGWRPAGHTAAHPPHLLLSSVEACLGIQPCRALPLPLVILQSDQAK